jgi:SpoVK/Ycf46/Vps4 family AAA+-type ATPase
MNLNWSTKANQSPNIYVQGIPKDIPEGVAAVCRSRLIDAVDKLLDKTKLQNVAITIATSDVPNLFIEGIPEGVSEAVSKSFRAKLERDVNDLLIQTGVPNIELKVSTANTTVKKSDDNVDPDIATERAKRYKVTQPLFRFEQLVVPKHVEDDLFLAVDLIQLETKVFDEWGLREIEPFPRTSLNFHGAPGTGKTLAAHAIASKIQRPILVASYAQIESMYHGEGPKNVEAIFLAAERDAAVLFIDEADSLLSKRLTHVTQGSEQAINSMRSQLLICLERFKGIVIFSTNLVENYDKAFETRVRHVHFPMPDETCRREIWRRHLPEKLPRTSDVSVEQLAKIEDVCGRDIKNVIIDTAMRVAREQKECISLADLLNSVERIKKARVSVEVQPSKENLSSQEKEEVQKKVQVAFADKDK